MNTTEKGIICEDKNKGGKGKELNLYWKMKVRCNKEKIKTSLSMGNFVQTSWYPQNKNPEP